MRFGDKNTNHLAILVAISLSTHPKYTTKTWIDKISIPFMNDTGSCNSLGSGQKNYKISSDGLFYRIRGSEKLAINQLSVPNQLRVRVDQ